MSDLMRRGNVIDICKMDEQATMNLRSKDLNIKKVIKMQEKMENDKVQDVRRELKGDETDLNLYNPMEPSFNIRLAKNMDTGPEAET